MFVQIYFAVKEQPLYYENYDLTSVVTPVNASVLQKLLRDTGYNRKETDFLFSGFKDGFDLGFSGNLEGVRRFSPNLKLNIGNHVTLWNKIMKEVKLKRFAGPYRDPPFDCFIQSPVGLVPKDNGRDTRLIFHLSYPRGGDSVNSMTPKKLCETKYPDFADAVRLCLQIGNLCFIGKSDMKSAFRNLGVKPSLFRILLLKAVSPFDGKTYYFVDKCLPFGHGISCNLFQRVSNCIAHIVRMRNQGSPLVNYLDDYFFADLIKRLCDQQIRNFLQVCKEINFPVSLDKTFWGSQFLVFLGLLINTLEQQVSIPADKVTRAKSLIEEILQSKKTTVHKMQKLCGFLNFLCRCVVPGRAFTRRLYTHFSSDMKPHYHINVKSDIKQDLRVWLQFLNSPSVYCRPFIDFSCILQAEELDWYTDASGVIGMGGYHGSSYFKQFWDPEFLEAKNPSIQYKELLAVTVSVLLWGQRYRNRRIRLFCDNDSVVRMINNSSTSCRNCMVLIRIIISKCLDWNLRVFGKHVVTDENNLADALSRGQMNRFWSDVIKENRVMRLKPEKIPEEIWPLDKIWLD